MFKARSFLKGVKELYTEHINLFLEDKDKLQVFSDKDIYLPTKKVGKNNPKAEEIKNLMKQGHHGIAWLMKLYIVMFQESILRR